MTQELQANRVHFGCCSSQQQPGNPQTPSSSCPLHTSTWGNEGICCKHGSAARLRAWNQRLTEKGPPAA